MRVDVVSIFPEMFEVIRGFGITRMALEESKFSLKVWNPRNFADNPHRRVDDRPYGGGPGMVMQAKPIARAIRAAKRSQEGKEAKVLLMSPQGEKLTQQKVQRLANSQASLVLVAGRYEGIDQRLIDSEIDEEISIGDYVVAGGELPSMILIEAIIRHIPGVLGNCESANEESFMNGLLDWPQYTRPEIYEGIDIPTELMTGDHEKIRLWRLEQALGKTWLNRPELLSKRKLNSEEDYLLKNFINEYQKQEGS